MRMLYLKNTPFGTLFLRSGGFNLCIYLLRVTFLWEHKIHFSALRQLYLFNATSSLQNTSLVPQMKVILKSTELLQLLSSCCRRKQTATCAECWGQGGRRLISLEAGEVWPRQCYRSDASPCGDEQIEMAENTMDSQKKMTKVRAPSAPQYGDN